MYRKDYYLFHNNLPDPVVGDPSPSNYACTDKEGRVILSENLLLLDSLVILGVIAHERMHLIFDTIPRGIAHGCDKDEKSWNIWNIAADAFINDRLIDLGYKLPSECIYLKDIIDKYKISPEPKTSEELYDFLCSLSKDEFEEEFEESFKSSNSPISLELSKLINQEEFNSEDDSEESQKGESGESSDSNREQSQGEESQSSDKDSSSNDEESGDSKSLNELVKEFVKNAKIEVNLDPENTTYGASKLGSNYYDCLGSFIKKVNKNQNNIVPYIINKLNTLVHNIEVRTYARLNRRCPAIKGVKRSMMNLSIILDVSGSMFGSKLDNAVSLATSLYSYLNNLGYKVDSYLLDTRITKIKSMTIQQLVDFKSNGGTELELVDTISGVRVVITDAEDNWNPKVSDRDTLLIYDSERTRRGVKCDFSKGIVIKDYSRESRINFDC